MKSAFATGGHRFRAISCLQGLLFIYIGCAASDRVQRPAQENSGIENFELMREDFDPTKLDDDDVHFEDTESENSDWTDVAIDRQNVLEDSIGTGYRVQIVQTTDPEEARNVQRDALLRFEHQVYRVFDPPFFKVRVGDFAHWSDAEKLQTLAINKGYREAWVIKTSVDLRRAYKTFDDF